MPIVPYQQHGGGQVPLRGFLSSVSSTSPASDLLPQYTPISVAPARDDTVYSAPDASHTNSRPSIDILVDHSPSQGPLEQAPINSLASSDESVDSDDQMKGRKPAIAAAGTFFSLTIFSQIYQRALFPRITPVSERAEERKWVASSQSWLDRRVCNWFGLCGLAHLDQTAWTSANGPKGQETLASASQTEKTDLSKFWKDASAVTNPKDFSDNERLAREIPEYVLEYAPYIHLYSGEEFWPCDIAEHLIHTTPHLNYTALQATSDHPNLTDLDDLNRWGRFVYLQSDDNVEDRPEWLGGKSNIPNAPDDSELELDTEWPDEDRLDEGSSKDVDGEDSSWWNAGIGDSQDRGGVRPLPGTITSPVSASSDALEGEESVHTPGDDWQPELTRRKLGKKVIGGRSDAPAVLIVVEKDNGVVDAFFFFFYSYNLGNKVFNVRFGNHVGDWEHTVVRFQNGVPKAVFFSEHSFGEAYTYEALEKIGKRPVGYSATGTHAMYAVPGTHPYVLPGGVLHDETDRGPLWDPLLNLYSYTYDYKNDRLRSSNFTPEAPIGWFYFAGHWGDKFYPLSDPRQYRFVGQYHYVNGPMGPRFKNLGRQQICQGNDECVLKRGLYSTRRRMKRWQDVGEGEEMSDADVRRFMGAEDGVETETR